MWGYSQEECEVDDYYYKGDGCVLEEIGENDDTAGYDDWFVDVTASDTKNCSECPIGSTCAGGTAGAAPCPAGSYCNTTGLSQPSGQCAKGTYSYAGAIACTSCPNTGLTDVNGNIVSATTAGTGATAYTACFVDPDTYFKDDQGTFHYKNNCTYEYDPRFGVSTEEECEKVGGYMGDWGCHLPDDSPFIPQTEEDCNALQVSWGTTWYDGKCHCEYEESTGVWALQESGLNCEY